MSKNALDITALEIVKSGKGILAADESTGTIKKRFDSIGLDSTEENRRTYRELLFTSNGIEKYISGIIMFDETLHQKTAEDEPFISNLTNKGMICGIKVDKSVWPLAGATDYPITEGLDGLQQRCDDYASLGARFTKWRAVIKIINSYTPEYAIRANAHALARYAAIAQQSDLVPIVEPEVLMDGNHSIETCQDITEKTLIAVYDELHKCNVRIEGTILKPNMILPGTESDISISPDEIVFDIASKYEVPTSL